MKRSPMKRKPRKNDDPKARHEYLLEHEACAACGASQFNSPFAGVQVHHLVGGAGRKDIRENFLSLCRSCHNHYHTGGECDGRGDRLPPLTPGNLMWCKRKSDPDYYSEETIAKLLGRVGLPDNWEPEPIA